MDTIMARPDLLAKLCADADATQEPAAFCGDLKTLMPAQEFEWVMTRGRWHRLGGIVDRNYQPVAGNIVAWVESEAVDDVEELFTRYMDAGHFVTQLAGKTHYFTAALGDSPEDFVQLEIEELCEVLNRPLIDLDWVPDSIEEFIDPPDYPVLEPEPVGNPYYQFRRVTPIAKLLDEASKENQALLNLKRFFEDWRNSSAFEGEHFCKNWALALREYMDSDGEYRTTARPVSTFAEKLPDLPPPETLQGAELANAIHSYDRQLGYPFAWYFIMLSQKAANYDLADAVLQDQIGAYDYLPARDVKVLRQWEEMPYGV